MATDLTLLSAGDLAGLFRSGEASPVDALDAAWARIEALDGEVNAFCLVGDERSVEQARASEERWRTGAPLGPLDGIPVGVKDVFLTRGWPTLKGSRLVDADQPWDDDAPVVAALRAAGAVFVGKTTTPEFGWKGVTDSPRHGVTRNPWDPSRTAGGSSGGSSAAVVLGMSTLALGTDGGGSIRIPAGFCGHPGIKPTYGTVPLWPASPYGTLAHAGPMARTVADLAAMLDVLAAPDPRDWTVLPAAARGAARGLDDGTLEGLRVAYSADLGWASVEREVSDLVGAAVQAFEALGAVVEPADPGFDDPLWAYEVLWNSGAAATTDGCTDDDRALMDPGFRRIREDGTTYSAVDYVKATAVRAALGERMGRFHEQWDLLLTPTLPLAAFEAGRDVPEGWPDPRWPTWTPFSYPFNLTQQPAASVPCGFTAGGLPVGLQIVGPRHADALVLAAAAAYEQAQPLDRRPALLGAAVEGAG